MPGLGRGNAPSSTGRCDMSGAREKNVHRLAERKGFRFDKVGKGQHRFYIIDLESSGRMFSGVPDHEYSFSLEQAEEWLARATIALRASDH